MRLQFGNYWMEFKGEPGSGVTSVESNLMIYRDIEPPESYDDEVRATVNGVESTMLALYSHGILHHANLTQVQQALEDVVDAIDNNID